VVRPQVPALKGVYHLRLLFGFLGAQVSAHFLYIKARNTRSSGANLRSRHIPKETALDVTAIDRLAPSGPPVRALYVSHFGNRLQDPSTFPLISFPRSRYYRTTQVIYKITAFFDNLTRAQLLAVRLTAESDQPDEDEDLRPALCCFPRAQPQPARQTR
jgi:hypothetical protein